MLINSIRFKLYYSYNLSLWNWGNRKKKKRNYDVNLFTRLQIRLGLIVVIAWASVQTHLSLMTWNYSIIFCITYKQYIQTYVHAVVYCFGYSCSSRSVLGPRNGNTFCCALQIINSKLNHDFIMLFMLSLLFKWINIISQNKHRKRVQLC